MKANRELSKIKGAPFYKIGDKVETIKEDSGAWFSADIIDISPSSRCDCEDDCTCSYKLLFDGDEGGEVEVVDRKLWQIRQVSYSSIEWDKLKVGMKVVINYNIEKPKQWGYWYDYFIENFQKRNDTVYLEGTLLVGYDGSSKKLPVKIDSDNVSDVLEIRPHATLEEKESEGYETGVKPEYCKKCRNKPKVNCKTCCCCKCGNKKDFELTVQCDECDCWYHSYCVDPPLKTLPDDEDWYCPKCNNETHRAKLELKNKMKKQKKQERAKKPRLDLNDDIQSPSKNKSKGKISNKSENTEQKQFDVEKLIKEIPKNGKIWNEVEKHFSDFEILRVFVEVVKKKNDDDDDDDDAEDDDNNDDDVIVNSKVEEYIKNDSANVHLWEEAKQSIENGKQAFLEAVKRIFTCPICCELLNDPITLSCKHSFCIDCFFRSLSVNVYNCPICRVHVIHTQHYGVNENLKKALAVIFKRKISKKIDAI